MFSYQLTGNHFCVAPKNLASQHRTIENGTVCYDIRIWCGIGMNSVILNTQQRLTERMNSEYIHPCACVENLDLIFFLPFLSIYHSNRNKVFHFFYSFVPFSSMEMPQCCACYSLILSIVRLYKSNTRLVFMDLRVFCAFIVRALGAVAVECVCVCVCIIVAANFQSKQIID